MRTSFLVAAAGLAAGAVGCGGDGGPVPGSGRVHVSYWYGTNGDLKYAAFAANCTTAANWEAVAVDRGGFLGGYTSLAVDASDRVHVSYYDGTNNDLKYATCAASCTTA